MEMHVSINNMGFRVLEAQLRIDLCESFANALYQKIRILALCHWENYGKEGLCAALALAFWVNPK